MSESRVKAFIQRVLQPLGYYIGRYPPAYSLEMHLAYLFKTLKINCVLDVGAHRGDYGRLLRSLGFIGWIVSFEPGVEAFDVLKRQAQLDGRWRVCHYALGAREQTAEMNIFDEGNFNSLLQPSAFGRERFGDRLRVARTQTVPVRRLDDVFAQCIDGIAEPRVFLKIDTQGYDRLVLDGFANGLRQIVGLQLEVSVRPIYEDMSNEMSDALRYLEQCGFHLTGLFPVSWDVNDQLSLIELDCVLCRTHTTPGS